MKVKIECEDRYRITLPSGKVLRDFKKESEWEGMVKFSGKEGSFILTAENKLFFTLGKLGIEGMGGTDWSVVSHNLVGIE